MLAYMVTLIALMIIVAITGIFCTVVTHACRHSQAKAQPSVAVTLLAGLKTATVEPTFKSTVCAVSTAPASSGKYAAKITRTLGETSATATCTLLAMLGGSRR